MSFYLRKHHMCNINTSYTTMQTIIMTSEELFITDICIHIKKKVKYFICRKKNTIVKELH